MNKHISDNILLSYVDKLPKEMEPQRDLWQGIEHAIQDKKQQNTFVNKQRYFVPAAWAASLIAAVLVGWVTFSPTPQITEPLVVSNENVLPSNAEQLIETMQVSFQQQKQALLVSYGQPDMSHLSANMQAQFEVLAQARKTIEKALLNDENNIDLLNLLRFTQQQELNLLQQLYPYMNDQNIQWQTI